MNNDIAIKYALAENIFIWIYVNIESWITGLRVCRLLKFIECDIAYETVSFPFTVSICTRHYALAGSHADHILYKFIAHLHKMIRPWNRINMDESSWWGVRFDFSLMAWKLLFYWENGESITHISIKLLLKHLC